MQILFLLFFIGIALPAQAEDIKWDESSIVNADIDCDSVPDTAKLGYIEDRVRLSVTLGASGSTQSIEFGLGKSG